MAFSQLKLIPEGGNPIHFQPLPGLREILSIPLNPLDNSLPPLKNTIFFELNSQPNKKQRKSYHNENRYILPNPIVIKPFVEKNVLKYLQGTVKVSLIYENGIELAQNSLEGELIRPLEGKEKEAKFQLKLLVITPKRLRLSFQVDYIIKRYSLEPNSNNSYNDCPSFEEGQVTVISQPFEVHSNSTRNRKAFFVPYPIVHKIIPTCEFQGGEVWIKGENFQNPCGVRFGDVWAKIVEISQNLIICKVPFQPIFNCNLDENLEVSLTVYNFQTEDEEKLEFLPSNIEIFRYGLEDQEESMQES